MNLFAWLLVGHLVGDFLLQTRWMAERKVVGILPLLVHSLVYTASVALLANLAGGLTLLAIAAVFIGHLIMDSRKFTDLWAKYVTGAPDLFWLKIVQDQSWHILILAVATLL